MRMRWFRIYSEMLNDEKVQLLSPELFKTWVNLLCVAATRDGVLPAAEKLAFQLRVSPHEMQLRIEDLILAGLIDIRPDKTFEPHNWQQRQWKSDDSAERVRKHREAKKDCNGYSAVTVTPPDTDTETYSETEINLAHSSFVKPREEKEQSCKFDLKTTKKEIGFKRSDGVVKRAEGLGLPVDEILETTNANPAVRSRGAYFTTLCVGRLQKQLPGLDEKLIRDALWGKDGKSFAVVTNLLLTGAAQ
jgi:hypothetical protein